MSEKELRELDAWILEHVFNLVENGGGYSPHDERTGITIDVIIEHSIPHYTTDPAAAMMVLEKCYDKAGTSICTCKTPRGFKLWLPSQYTSAVESETLPLAIALFAKQLYKK